MDVKLIYYPKTVLCFLLQLSTHVLFTNCISVCVGRDSVVSTATRYGIDGPGIECRWGRDLSPPCTPIMGPT
jgi:hypothetical protein